MPRATKADRKTWLRGSGMSFPTGTRTSYRSGIGVREGNVTENLYQIVQNKYGTKYPNKREKLIWENMENIYGI